MHSGVTDTYERISSQYLKPVSGYQPMEPTADARVDDIQQADVYNLK